MPSGRGSSSGSCEAIDRLATLDPRSDWVEPLVRRLGCDCPAEVFADIARLDRSTFGCEALAIGGRLLVGFAGAEQWERTTQIFQLARAYRDAHGYNRFRLVLVGALTQQQVSAAERAASSEGERLHVHSLDEDTLAAQLSSPADLDH